MVHVHPQHIFLTSVLCFVLTYFLKIFSLVPDFPNTEYRIYLSIVLLAFSDVSLVIFSAMLPLAGFKTCLLLLLGGSSTGGTPQENPFSLVIGLLILNNKVLILAEALAVKLSPHSSWYDALRLRYTALKMTVFKAHTPQPPHFECHLEPIAS